MNILTLDFETYFDADYSLSKMTTEAYVRDPRFEVHGVGVIWPHGERQWITERAVLMSWFRTLTEGAILCHHAAFDGLVLSHHYGIKPARWLDTYSMAQFLFGPEQSKSLEALAKRFGLDAKSVPYDMMRGRHWASLTDSERAMVSAGCLHDCELTWTIFNKMMKGDY